MLRPFCAVAPTANPPAAPNTGAALCPFAGWPNVEVVWPKAGDGLEDAEPKPFAAGAGAPKAGAVAGAAPKAGALPEAPNVGAGAAPKPPADD